MTIIKEVLDSAGGGSAVARALKISRSSVSEWITNGRIPPKHVLALAELTDWEYTPHMLAPALYPNPTDGLPSLMSG